MTRYSSGEDVLFEHVLTIVWSELLGLGPVDVDASFFTLGGDSLFAMQLVAQLRELFQIELPVTAVFEFPTIRSMAEALARNEWHGRPEILPVSRDEALPLSFSQERLWFIEQYQPGAAYNMVSAYRAHGPLDAAALAYAIDAIVGRHEPLRTTFALEGGQPAQRIGEAATSPLIIDDLTQLPAGECNEAGMARLQRVIEMPFDLDAGPLFRAHLVRLADDEHLLAFVIHHSVCDDASLVVLLNELATLYPTAGRGEAGSLPPLTVQYADYAVWQRQCLGAELEQQLDYWKSELADAPFVLDLPSDRSVGVSDGRGARLTFSIDADLTQRLRDVARECDATLFMTLLAGFELLLARDSNQNEFCIGLPITGRDRRELESLIGVFVNMLALRARVDSDAGT